MGMCFLGNAYTTLWWHFSLLLCPLLSAAYIRSSRLLVFSWWGMARLVKSPQKYLPSEWHTSNRFNYTSAEKERAAAQRLRAECERLRKETDATTARTQQDTAHKFSQRLRDVDFWKAELERKLADNGSETEILLQRKEQLEQALVSTQFPLEVAQTCLGLREQRTSIDLVQDDVEMQLMKVCSMYKCFFPSFATLHFTLRLLLLPEEACK